MSKIINYNYQKFLLKIRAQIDDTQENILKSVTRQKVVMAWNIGQLIDEYLPNKSTLSKGEGLIRQLSFDIGITSTVLYKMRNFYQTYPDLPKDNPQLNWSHYRVLSGVKDRDERHFLENLVVKNAWGNRQLTQEVQKRRGPKFIEGTFKEEKKKEKQHVQAKLKLFPVRGQLFTYPLVDLVNQKEVFVDFGFNIFKNLADFSDVKISARNTVKSFKNADGEYVFSEISINKKRMNIYKARLERVVDGDTIRVILDLGFGIFHREILRLEGINAPEMRSDEGRKSKKILENILQKAPFLVVKTIKIDIFGRYVADIFFDASGDGDVEAQIVADNGVYLNQMLVDQGIVETLVDYDQT